MTAPVKAALEDLLRARFRVAAAPPLRGEDLRPRPLPSGIPLLDEILGGGFPRGQLSQIVGPASSGRTGVATTLVARATRAGALAAWIDPADCFDPCSASEAGVDGGRLLWLRGGALPRVVSAAHTLAGSGLFDVVVLDLAAVYAECARLPAPTWRRLQRALADQPVALVLLAPGHVAASAGGVALSLGESVARWSGAPGPGRLLRGVGARARAGRFQPRPASFELTA
ncbi:MAG TPA: hypothetical protein VII13_22335 [Vicinamibacteria bacterium]|jgi:hypothetical protein